MATASNQFTVTLTAGSDLSRWRSVALVGGDVEYVANAKDPCIGVTTDAAVDGGPVSVQIAGVAKVTAGGAITKGHYLYSGGSFGRVVGDADVDASERDTPLGYALDSASANNEVIRILLIQTNPTVA